MALVGGAGNVAGSNPTGTGSTLNYVLDRVYGYSGTSTVGTGGAVMLSFTTGSETIQAEFQFSWGSSSNYDVTPEITIDGQTIWQQYIQAAQLDYPQDLGRTRLILPPYTQVTVEQVATGNVTLCSTTVTGRIISA